MVIIKSRGYGQQPYNQLKSSCECTNQYCAITHHTNLSVLISLSGQIAWLCLANLAQDFLNLSEIKPNQLHCMLSLEYVI